RPGSTSRARLRHLDEAVAGCSAGRAEAGSSQAGSGSSGPPVSIGDLTKLWTTGPDEPPVCAVPGPDAASGGRPATLGTVRTDAARTQIDLAPGSPSVGLRGIRPCQPRPASASP